jgi:valyl-tRNA synthetase
MAPFITEELFQTLKQRLPGTLKIEAKDPYTTEALQALQSPACIVAPYPQLIRESDLNPEINESFELLGNVVYTIRNIRGEVKLPPSAVTDVHIIGSEEDANFLKVKHNCKIISALVRTQHIEFHTREPQVGFCSIGVLGSLKIMIPIPDEFLKQEKKRLEKEQEKLAGALDRIRKQLSNQEFINHAPVELIEKQKSTLQQAEVEIGEIAAKLEKM